MKKEGRELNLYKINKKIANFYEIAVFKDEI